MRIKDLRIKEGMTQKSLARLLNTTGQTILNWENGLYSPNVKQLIQLANIFNCSIDYLVGRKDSTLLIEDVCHEVEKIAMKDFVSYLRTGLIKINNK